jgi:Dioxygenase
MMIVAPGFRKLTTALYPEGDIYLSSDVVFGVKKSLVVVSNGFPLFIFFGKPNFLFNAEPYGS